ncbi:hypothetical protein [Streptomyces sp. NPDC093094]|uniref:hypothetical protein n=1 Tax=Streptomyces sp. NPDC093094 TaxID=3366026 RepID=UPI00381BE94E
MITPTRRSHAPHLGASLALALRLNRARPARGSAVDVRAAEDLPALSGTDADGPWVLSLHQLDVLTRAMDARYWLCSRERVLDRFP